MKKIKNSFAFSIAVTLQSSAFTGNFSGITKIINDLNAEIFAVSPLALDQKSFVILCCDLEHEKKIIAALRIAAPRLNFSLLAIADRVFSYHLGGKISVTPARPLATSEDLAIAYTPGVARPCMAIYDDIRQMNNLTIKARTVAVVSDGTAVLGLGDIGPAAAMPVMEGKCLLFKHFAGVDAFPICLATKEVAEIVETVERLSPTFGGINLEDISAPRCFEVEARLKKSLNIPVFHDDQHGTAIVVLAGLINALKVVGKIPTTCRTVINGAGAAGLAIAQMLLNYGFTHLTLCDRHGIIHRANSYNNPAQQAMTDRTNPENLTGDLAKALKGADIFVGVSAPNVVSEAMVKTLAQNAIVFAMANPAPEIMPEIAAKYVKIMATGRSDYPNQINNVLAFPGVFRGALEARATAITDNMKLAAALAIANSAAQEKLSPQFIIPSPFLPELARNVATAVRSAALNDGVAGEIVPPPNFDDLHR